MARISTYIKDNTLTDNDKLLGTDAAGRSTKNFELGDIKSYMEENAEFNAETTIFTQSTASPVWSIVHNLEKFPSVTIVDSTNDLIIGDIVYNNNNSLTINFSSATTGKAYLN